MRRMRVDHCAGKCCTCAGFERRSPFRPRAPLDRIPTTPSNGVDAPLCARGETAAPTRRGDPAGNVLECREGSSAETLIDRMKFPFGGRSSSSRAACLSGTRLDSFGLASAGAGINGKQDRESGLKNLDDLDDFGQRPIIAETPVFIGFWTTWTTWTTSFYSRKKNKICKRLLMRATHSNGPGQPWL